MEILITAIIFLGILTLFGVKGILTIGRILGIIGATIIVVFLGFVAYLFFKDMSQEAIAFWMFFGSALFILAALIVILGQNAELEKKE